MNNKELQTDLFEAIDAGNVRRVEVLLDMGVDIGVERLNSNVSNAPSYITPMQYALNKNDHDIISLIYAASGKNGTLSDDDMIKANEYLNTQETVTVNPTSVDSTAPNTESDPKQSTIISPETPDNTPQNDDAAVTDESPQPAPVKKTTKGARQ